MQTHNNKHDLYIVHAIPHKKVISADNILESSRSNIYMYYFDEPGQKVKSLHTENCHSRIVVLNIVFHSNLLCQLETTWRTQNKLSLQCVCPSLCYIYHHPLSLFEGGNHIYLYILKQEIRHHCVWCRNVELMQYVWKIQNSHLWHFSLPPPPTNKTNDKTHQVQTMWLT